MASDEQDYKEVMKDNALAKIRKVYDGYMDGDCNWAGAAEELSTLCSNLINAGLSEPDYNFEYTVARVLIAYLSR